MSGGSSARPVARRCDLVAFDIDGTLVRESRGLTVWEVLNERFTGRADHNQERWALYRAGKITYAEWVDLDIGGWRDAGATREDLIAAMAPLRLVDGVRETLAALEGAGVRLIVISGTLDLLLDTLLPGAPFDEVYANHIGFDATGRISHWRATPFDMEGKAKLLRAVALRTGTGLARCGFVGDSANDVWIAGEAGFSLAFNPTSPELERIAHATVRSDDLRSILPHFLPAGGPAPARGPHASGGRTEDR
jgi:HAD superfamily phosphoserine phosphatase-like hydrolase